MNTDYLNSVGKILSKKDLPEDFTENEAISKNLKYITSFLTKTPSKSVLLTGESGVGKTSVILQVVRTLVSRNWKVFQATAKNIIAGQRYIGDVEESVQNIIKELKSNTRNVWVIPQFDELHYAGRHKYSTSSVLDQILEHVENGEIKILGEINARSLEKIAQQRPQILSAFEIIRILPTSAEVTIDLSKKWLQKAKKNSIWKGFEEADLTEIYYLAKQYISHQENPGNLFDLLKQTEIHVKNHGIHGKYIAMPDFIKTLSHVTGLPENILDDNIKLDLENISTRFTKRVIGQEDAVKTIVERVAMIKAGLTDPSKPSGVFLFVGPTGTGKTELAKTLADFLFGSEERLIRLDMSEFQTADATYRLIGDVSEESENTALVNRIRRDPFSVILLDEFEKAHPYIWDFFLQVFDDGRLTDQQGNTADFRHSIIILTSNLGASIPKVNRIGFNNVGGEEVDVNILQAINETFRPEFVNRIDKIVVFNPLTKSVARQILRGELKKILKRRGLRRRKWELDFDDSALEFLLDQGFSSTLGARPLRRAIEKYLLAPLAITIVNHNFPEGNQFLLVSAGKQKLKVEFIDPDEPEYSWEQKKDIVKHQSEKSKSMSLASIILDTNGVLSEFQVIEKEMERIGEYLKKGSTVETKAELLEALNEADFWNSPDRFEVLAEIEMLDSFSNAFDAIENLYNRLNDPEKERVSYDARLINKLAAKLYHLDLAMGAYENEQPQDALLQISYEKVDADYGDKIKNMFEQWGKQRNMRFHRFNKSEEADEVALNYTVTGFGAYTILLQEVGYHVFEVDEAQSGKVVKHKVKVSVLPMELEDYRKKNLGSAIQRFKAIKTYKNAKRYRLKKSPFVKDLNRNHQTGKIEKVLAGYFDVV